VANRNYSSAVFLGAAVVAGAIAFWLSHVYLKKQEERIRDEAAGRKPTSTEVVVAAHALNVGDIVNTSTMAVSQLPTAHVSARFITPKTFYLLQGHVLTHAKADGEPLLVDDVAGVMVSRFSDLLKPGERAVTLDANDVDSNAGLLLPGDYVDLFVIVKPESAEQGAEQDRRNLVPVLEQVRVLAAGKKALVAQDQKYQTLDEKSSRYSTITVAVPIADAEKILLAKKMGDMAYLLRSSADSARDVATLMSSGEVNGEDSAGIGRSYLYFSQKNSAGVLRQVEGMGQPVWKKADAEEVPPIAVMKTNPDAAADEMPALPATAPKTAGAAAQ
jgi:pilus assembly protein CpaB